MLAHGDDDDVYEMWWRWSRYRIWTIVWTSKKLGLDSQHGQEIVRFSTISKLVLGPTLLSVK
jgi:hypothetical protein